MMDRNPTPNHPGEDLTFKVRLARTFVSYWFVTARSRNDQVALDLRLYLRDRLDEIAAETEKLISLHFGV